MRFGVPFDRQIVRARPWGLGLSPADIAALQNQGVATAYATTAASQLQGQGQQLYDTANQAAAVGTGVANGDLSSVVIAVNFTANNVPPSSTSRALQQAFKSGVTSAVGAIATYGALTTAVGWLTANGFLVAGGAIAEAIPVFGTMVAAGIAAAEILLTTFGASSPTSSTPGVITALLETPLPNADTASTQGIAPTVREPVLFNAGIAVPCSTALGSGTAGAATAAWRDFLDFTAQGAINRYPALGDPSPQRGRAGLGWPYPGGSGFRVGCPSAPNPATWQDAADQQLQGVGFAMGGQPYAEAAIALAVRWVPFGDPWIAPYQDGIASLPGAPAETMYILECNLASLAVAYANWPQALADQQALAYLTTLAWVWSNFPGNAGVPLPGWIAYKLGHLQALVAGDALVQPAAGASASTSTLGMGTQALVGTASALAALVVVHGLATRQGPLASARSLWGRVEQAARSVARPRRLQ